MPCDIVGNEEGLLTVRISGLLEGAELARAGKTAVKAMQSMPRLNFPILAGNFQGWDRQDGWGDVSFQMKHGRQIEKIALVGKKRWQELAEAFVGKGFRSIDISD